MSVYFPKLKKTYEALSSGIILPSPNPGGAGGGLNGLRMKVVVVRSEEVHQRQRESCIFKKEDAGHVSLRERERESTSRVSQSASAELDHLRGIHLLGAGKWVGGLLEGTFTVGALKGMEGRG
jgi:hypothetical protein